MQQIRMPSQDHEDKSFNVVDVQSSLLVEMKDIKKVPVPLGIIPKSLLNPSDKYDCLVDDTKDSLVVVVLGHIYLFLDDVEWQKMGKLLYQIRMPHQDHNHLFLNFIDI